MRACNMTQARYEEADIMPDNPPEMVEFYRPDNRSGNARDSLGLQTLVWETDGVMGGPIVIGSLDFTVGPSNVLRDRAVAALRTGREQIIVCFSHTHNTPNATEIPDYFEMVCRQTDTAIREAAGKIEFMEVT